jgi:hypothetical protein
MLLAFIDGILGAFELAFIFLEIVLDGRTLPRGLLPTSTLRRTPFLLTSAVEPPATAPTPAALTRPRAELRNVRGRLDRAELFDDHETVARIEEIEPHFVEAEACVGSDQDPLLRLALELRELLALLVLEVERHVRTHRQFDP